MITTLSPRRSLLGIASALAVAASGFALITPAAQAADATTSDASLSWTLSEETGGGAYNGSCNFLTAGTVGDAKSSHGWSDEEGKAWYKASDGAVSLSRTYGTPSWDTRCTGPDGKKVSPFKGSSTNTAVTFSRGTGTIDAAAGTADVTWKGSATVVFYGGLTYWSFSDPHLVIGKDGTGTLTATASGYGADMNDTSKWTTLKPTTVTMATFHDAKVTAKGFTATPDYAGVKVEVPGDTAQPQVRTNPGWGAFPQSFVDFQVLTGQSSYWYSSGGNSDPKKVATPISFAWSAKETPTEPQPTEDPDGTKVDVGVTVPATPTDPTNPIDPTDPTDPTNPTDPTGPTTDEFTYTVSSGSADLGSATANASGFSASGQLPTVSVTDTRKEKKAFTISGKASAFSDGSGQTIPASALGWAPAFASGENTVGATVGAAVDPNAPGLGSATTLVAAASGHSRGTAKVNASLKLQAPATTPSGSYTSHITITAVG